MSSDTKPRSRRRRWRELPLLLALGLAPAWAEQVVVRGDDGATGADASAPGAAGGDGAAGGSVASDVLSAEDWIELGAAGGRGGAGGAGGPGNASTAGGPAGAGGRGGDARGLARARAQSHGAGAWSRARGGNGGHGGPGGTAGAGGGAGRGGDGGNGGDAHASAEARAIPPLGLSHAESEATGGAGGFARGTGARAGRGGDAGARAFANEGYSASATALAGGGAGGAGWDGAAGGAGGRATLVDAATVRYANQVWLTQRASGGHGGYADSGLAGDGGTAVSALSFEAAANYPIDAKVSAVGGDGGRTHDGTAGAGGHATARGSIVGNRPVALTVEANAGRGGWGDLERRSFVGGAAGNAHAEGSARAGADYDAVVKVRASGGYGGPATGAGRRGTVGGTATGSASAESVNGIASAELELWAGPGGGGLAGASGGRGADVVVANAVRARSGQRVYLDQRAHAGFGGHVEGGPGGDGGDASSSIDLVDTRASFLSVGASAWGGDGGPGLVGGRGGRGTASVRVVGSAPGSVVHGGVSVTGGFGYSGGASGEAVGDAVTEGATTASSSAYAVSGERARASAVARQTGSGGGAFSAASARSNTHSDAEARSHARLSAYTTADADTLGRSGRAVAFAEATGPSGRTIGGSAIASTLGETRTRVRLTHGSREGWSGLHEDLMRWQQSATVVDGTPSYRTVRDALARSPEVAAALAAGGVDVVAIGASGLRHGEAGAQTLEGDARIGFTLDESRHVVLGFVDHRTQGDERIDFRFSVHDGDTMLVDRSFDSLAGAGAFLGDPVLDLGVFSGAVDLVIRYALTGAGAAAIRFEYLVATGASIPVVPEPATWALWLVGVAALGAFARRRRSPR